MQYGFVASWVLVFLPILFVVFYMIGRKYRVGRVLPNPLLSHYTSVSWIERFAVFLRYVIIAIALFICAGPYLSSTYIYHEYPKNNIAIILDLSLSMLAEDIHPNRIEAAKSVIEDFVKNSTNSHIGLIMFAGKPFVGIPLSDDTDGILSILTTITPRTIDQSQAGLMGTAIGDGLIAATNMLSGAENPKIILMTDGKANVGFDPRIAIKEVAGEGIPLYAIGIGASSGTLLYQTDEFGKKSYFLDENGKPIAAELDEELMRYMANITGGEYYNAANTSLLSQAFAKIDASVHGKGIEKHDTIEIPIISYTVIAIIFLILLERFLTVLFWRKYKLP